MPKTATGSEASSGVSSALTGSGFVREVSQSRVFSVAFSTSLRQDALGSDRQKETAIQFKRNLQEGVNWYILFRNVLF